MGLTVGAIAAIVGVAVAAGGTAISISESRKAQKTQEQQAAVQARRQQIGEIREARVARAAIINQAAQQEGTSSSATQGAASVGSQLAANLSFLDTNRALGARAASQQGRANLFSGIAQLGGQVSSIALDFNRRRATGQALSNTGV